MRDLQRAADDVGVIAETVDTLHKLLDKLRETHGDVIWARFVMAFPRHDVIGNVTINRLYALEEALTAPDEVNHD